MKASFSKRVFAYMIDFLFISMITSFFTMFIPTSKTVEKLYTEQMNIIEQYQEKKIDTEAYYSQSMDLSYDLSKQTALYSIVSILVSIIYFIVIPFYQNGQTLGKRVLKIKVQKKNHAKLTMNDLVIRSSLNQAILVNVLLVALVLFAQKDVYLWGNTILNGLQSAFIIISIILIAFSKEKEGLYDKIVHTEVVCVETTVKEVEDAKCEN